MPPKYMSGAQKRKKKERQDALSQGQAGAIDKVFFRTILIYY